MAYMFRHWFGTVMFVFFETFCELQPAMPVRVLVDRLSSAIDPRFALLYHTSLEQPNASARADRIQVDVPTFFQ